MANLNQKNNVPFYLLRPLVQINGQNLGYQQGGYGYNISEANRRNNKEKAALVTKGLELAVSRETSKYNDKQQLDAKLRKKYGSAYDPDKVRAQLQELISAGYDLGKTGVDGDWGPNSKAAWKKYQAKKANKKVNQTSDQIEKQSPEVQLLIAQFPGKAVDRNGNITEECAAYINGILSKNTRHTTWGNSYATIKGNSLPFVANGYSSLELPNLEGKSNSNQVSIIHKFNKAAADNLASSLDTLTLDKNHLYPVNMYYLNHKGIPSPNTSKFFLQAKEGNTGTYGTHTGVLYFSPERNEWRVNHNIHGNVQDEPLSEDLGSNAKHGWGITAVGDAGKIGATWYNPFSW